MIVYLITAIAIGFSVFSVLRAIAYPSSFNRFQAGAAVAVAAFGIMMIARDEDDLRPFIHQRPNDPSICISPVWT